MPQILIRDRDMRIVLRGDSPSTLALWNRGRAIERADVWPARGGGCQLGLAWADGSTYIGDWPDLSACLAWCLGHRMPAYVHGARAGLPHIPQPTPDLRGGLGTGGALSLAVAAVGSVAWFVLTR